MQGLVLKTIHCNKCDKHVKPKMETYSDEKQEEKIAALCPHCSERLKLPHGTARFGIGFGTLSE